MGILNLLSPTAWGIAVALFLAWGWVCFDAGGDLERFKMKRAEDALNSKLDDVNARESDLKTKADRQRIGALAKAVAARAPSEGCKATKAEAETISRIR